MSKILSKKWLTIPMFLFLTIHQGYSQEGCDVGEPYTEKDFGGLATDRNYPLPAAIKNSKIVPYRTLIVPCRTSSEKAPIFEAPVSKEDISDLSGKPYHTLTKDDLFRVINNFWFTKDSSLLDIVSKIALTDTLKKNYHLRTKSIRSLSSSHTEVSKKVLISLLQDRDNRIALFSALSLAQLGFSDISFKYIKEHYSEFIGKRDINTALMNMNTPESVKLLMAISEDADPSMAIDALGALSLLGYCEFAFKGFLRYMYHPVIQVRRDIAWCLAYYTGTPEALKLINKIPNDEYNLVKKDIQMIQKVFGITDLNGF